MKNVLKQTGKAICYFILYVLGQTIVGFIVQFICGMIAGAQIRNSGLVLTQEELIAYATNFYAGNMGIDLAARAIFTLLFLLVFFAIRKKKVAHELDLRKAPAIKFGAAALGAIFVIFTVNMSLSLLVPQNNLEEFTEASQVLYAYPLWQALLANALLVPILEEVIFRGLLFSRLQKAMPNVIVALITSVAFGLVHGQLIWMIFAFVVGLVLSYVRIKADSILPTIMMHVMINTYATAVNFKLITIESNVVAIILYATGILSLIGCIVLLQMAGRKKSANPSKVEVSTVVI